MKYALQAILSGICFLNWSSVFAFENTKYLVQRGDTVSGILHKHSASPIYGPNGSLASFVLLNPQIGNIHRIRPGFTVTLPLVQNIPVAELHIPIQNAASVSQDVAASPSIPSLGNQIGTNRKPSSQEQAFTGYSELETFGAYGFSKIGSIYSGANADLYSKGLVGGGLIWRQFWSEKDRTLIGLDYLGLGFESPASGTLVGSSQTNISGLKFGYERDLESNLIVGVLLSYGQRIYLVSPSQGSVRLERAQTADLNLSVAKELFSVKKMKFLAKASARYLPSASTASGSLKGGFGGDVGVRIEQNLKNWSLFAEGVMGAESRKLDLYEQNVVQVFAKVGFLVPIGKEE